MLRCAHSAHSLATQLRQTFCSNLEKNPTDKERKPIDGNIAVQNGSLGGAFI
ncbi:MAG: hypothetical protein ACYYK0_04265 [Candidatus Eutrophobiaceae bacterium]